MNESTKHTPGPWRIGRGPGRRVREGMAEGMRADPGRVHGYTMSLILQHSDYRTLWECRRLPHPITVRGNRWLAVLRVGPWSLILARRVSS